MNNLLKSEPTACDPHQRSFSNERPIYLQLAEMLKLRILIGSYRPGERLPSVRELAGEYMVNPNTLQRAMSELEGLGLITTQRTVGRTITDDTALIEAQRRRLAESYIDDFISRMSSIGCSREQIYALLNERKDINNG